MFPPKPGYALPLGYPGGEGKDMATVLEEAKVEEQRGRERLTDKRLEKLTARPGERVEIADTLVRELRVRVGKSGKKSWSMFYRVALPDGRRGAMKRLNLGTYPGVSLSDARDKARQALEAADKGIDPAAVRAEENEQRQTRAFEVVFDRFVELHVKQNTKEGRFARDRAAMLEKAKADGTINQLKGPKKKLGRVAAERIIADNALPHWRGRLVETIRRAEVHDLLDDVIAEEGVALARELRKHLTKLFNWAADRGYMPASPMAGLRRPELGYSARERVLSMEELRRVWDAAGELGYPFGPAYRLLILTGQRRSEIAEMERSWIDRDLRAVETPASRYKTGTAQVYPLSAPAWAIVDDLPQWNAGDCMFSTTGGERPISGFSKAKERLDEKIAELEVKARAKGLEVLPMQPWTVHDLRRSVATHMARLGIAQEHIERVLGHVVAGVAGTYNRYSYLDEKRAALEAWGKLWTAK